MQTCKLKTECAFYEWGYDQALSDALFLEKNQHINHIIYSQLAVATVGGTAHHMVKISEDKKYGNAVWKSMCE